MTQQFKFGDRVRHENPIFNGIVTQIRTDGVVIVNEFGNDFFFYVNELSELELVPHPDTARLDFIEKVINIDGMVKRKMGEGWTLVAEHELSEPKHLLRDAIDAAMRIQAAEAV